MEIVKQKMKFDVYKSVLAICVVVFVVISVQYHKKTTTLDADLYAVTQIESMHSNIQRVSKLELENNVDDDLIKMIDYISYDLLPSDKDSQYFVGNDEMLYILKDVIADWENFKEVVYNFRENGEREILFSTSENAYNNTSTYIKSLKVYTEESSDSISSLETILVGLVAIIALILIKILLNTVKELQHNKEISKEMYIDAATGIYNRSKCQEIMKTPPNSGDKHRAVVIFDLNDLKKTNDSLGHRAGDQLIHDFAQQVKNATKIFPYEIFVGRYGGDEFMAFLDAVDVRDVELYIEEVNYLLKNFNETEGKAYKLSCAAGYGITTDNNKNLTIKELFDIADADMYKNKITMKEKKRQELIAQGVEVAEEVDDRL